MTASVLDLLVQDKFQLYVYEKGGLGLGVVTQLRFITLQTEAYSNTELNQEAKGWPVCFQAVAAVSFLVPEAQKLILNRPWTVYTPHDPGKILNSKGRLL
jgi:hypothetical protein